MITGRKGTQAVEFTLILPILLTLLFAIIEYGWAMASWIVITNAASQGARAAITGKNAEFAIKEALWEAMTDNNPAGELTITTEELAERVPSSEYPRRYKVTVAWNFQELIGFLPSYLVPNTLSSESVMAFP